MATVDIQAVSKVYPGGVTAVEDINASIADGEFVVLVGPSGCGKSTILRMIAGLETITTGDLAIDGVRVNDMEPGDRDIAMVFQNYALYPHMTVRRNMEYGLKNEGMPSDQIADRIAEAARTLRLGDYLDRKPRQLSGGQRQRVAMGRAIVRQPKVFLFDEPLSNLDAKLRTELRAELKALHHRLKATFVYVTHDQIEAMSLADRIAIMNMGRIEQIGTPMEIYNTPASRFVADFIGNPSMNFIEGIVTEDRRGLAAENGERLVDLETPLSATPGTTLTVGIRPEHLAEATQSDVGLSVSVMFQEQLGADTLLHARSNVENHKLTVRFTGQRHFEPGTSMALSFSSEHLHLFSSENGMRIGA